MLAVCCPMLPVGLSCSGDGGFSRTAGACGSASQASVALRTRLARLRSCCRDALLRSFTRSSVTSPCVAVMAYLLAVLASYFEKIAYRLLGGLQVRDVARFSTTSICVRVIVRVSSIPLPSARSSNKLCQALLSSGSCYLAEATSLQGLRMAWCGSSPTAW